MQHSELCKSLTDRLKLPLPGHKAHALMMPAGRKLGLKFPTCLWARKSAVCILLYPVNGQSCAILIQRNEYKGVHSGQISLPGGRREKQDKTLIDTALRETYEEIGVNPETLKVLGCLSKLYIPPSNFLVLPVLACTDSIPEFIPDPAEVQQLIHFNTDTLLDPLTVKEKVFKGAFYSINAPYFDIQGHAVWGATAMILSEFKWLLSMPADQ